MQITAYSLTKHSHFGLDDSQSDQFELESTLQVYLAIMQANSERHHRLFFDETPDSCVQLVALLEYVIQSSLHDVLSAESMVCLLEKGSLYRGYMSLDDLSLVEKILYILQKFGEYNER